MTFINDHVRQNFHSLSLDKQRSIIDADAQLLKVGNEVTILFVDPEWSEITVRIDKKLDRARA